MAKRPRTCPALEAFAWLAQAAGHLAVVQGLGWLMEGAQSWWADLPEDHLLEHYLWVKLPVARQLVFSLAGTLCQYTLVSYCNWEFISTVRHSTIEQWIQRLYLTGGVQASSDIQWSCKSLYLLNIFEARSCASSLICICNLQPATKPMSQQTLAL